MLTGLKFQVTNPNVMLRCQTLQRQKRRCSKILRKLYKQANLYEPYVIEMQFRCAWWASGYSVLDSQSRGSGLKSRAEIWFEISYPPAPPSQLSYDEYTDSTLSVGR